MIPAIAIAAGVLVGANVLRCIVDELSSEEVRKQDEISKKQASLKESYLQYKDDLDFYKQEQIKRVKQDEADAATMLRREHFFQVRKLVIEHCNELISSATQQLADKESLYVEICDTITTVRAALKGQTTMLRRNSLLCLLRELEEARERIYAYHKVYLPRYVKNIEGQKNSNTLELPEMFSFTLPKEFFYTGKLIYLKKKDILQNSSITINTYGSLNYCFNEFEFIKDLPDETVVPLMCDQFLGAPHFTRVLSAKKGYFKNIVTSNPKIGITATVTGYDIKRRVLLSYNDCVELYLPKTNLANEKRYPPIGANIRVYPTNWMYNLSKPAEVSERTSDSYLCYSFDDLPIVFSRSQWVNFSSILEEKGLLSRTGDWKIAPLSEEHISNIEEVKLQLDNDIIFAAKIVDLNGRFYFSFNGLLSQEQFVHPDDVFLGIDCTLNVFLDSDMEQIDKSIQENMTNLILMCLSEFKVQYQTKLSRHGMEYFNKWSETTDRLITYLHKGRSAEIEVECFIKDEREFGDVADYTIVVHNPDTLKEFVDSVYEEAKYARNVEFFFELSPGIHCYVSIKGDANAIYVSEDATLMDNFLNDKHIITLYQKSFPYAEIQQAVALHQFRVGRLANPLLQSYALDSKNVQSNMLQQEISLFNQKICSDSSQLAAVEHALGEKDIYFIQGPPGTGKTTVIREIILQTLSANPLTKILVVSQANVAVDNVLKGLLNHNDLYVDFVRCGHLDKIDTQIETHSFEFIYEKYVDNIRRKVQLNPDDELISRWGEIVLSENQYNPNVGELILKSQPIIGATCVGLAQKRIGLDRIIYDLVIIDEAGKALPAEILIPYIRGKKVILIGDHMQLPPTVHPALLDPEKIEIEDRSLYEDDLFNTSFFQRLYNSAPDTNKCMLATQYRMPSTIGTLVSDLFYNHALANGYGTDEKLPLYYDKNLTLIDMHGPKYREASESGRSVTNPGEAQLVVSLLRKIRASVPSTARIAVITPYKGQKRLIFKQIIDSNAKENLKGVDINTIDAFQGDEAEIVIFCCTRTQTLTNFFKDPRRINVAFSRAKNELIILGSIQYFRRYDNTSVLPKVAEYIQQHGNILSVSEAFFAPNHLSKQSGNHYGTATAPSTKVIPLASVIVSSDLRATPPKERKVRAVMEFYAKHGQLDKPIVVRPFDDGYYLQDKYLRFFVAEQLGLDEIPAIIIQ